MFAIEFPLEDTLWLLELEDVELVTVVDVDPATDPVPDTLYDVPWPESGVQTPVEPLAAVRDCNITAPPSLSKKDVT